MRICAVCGGHVPEPDAQFCGHCGAPMAAAPVTPVTPVKPAPVVPTPPGLQARRPDEPTAVARPVSRPTDSVATSLQPASVAADPGGMVAVTLRARNTGTVVDELHVSVEGPIASWAEVEAPVLRLMPGTDSTSTIRLRPPLQPLALAGQVPFLVRVRSRQHPTEEATETGVLTVGEVRSLAATVVPATAKTSGTATYELRIQNNGNRPAGVGLAASDPDEALRLELDATHHEIPAGGELRLSMRATPRTAITLGAEERHAFRVEVTSEGRPAAQASGTLVQRPRFPGWVPPVAIGAAGIAVLALAGFALGILPPGAEPSPSLTGIIESAAPSVPVAPSEAPASEAPPSEAVPSAETEPTPPVEPTPTPSPTPLPPGACVDGYEWRLITGDDKACVLPRTVKQARADEAAATIRWVDGLYGPQTCIDGYVWREAFPSDLVCVTPDIRAFMRFEVERAPFRVAPRTDTCKDEFVWREATPEDHVCVDKAERNQAIEDNLAAPTRWYEGAYGPQTCVDGFWWRQVTVDDYVCVTQAVKDQIALDNARALERVGGS